MDKSPPFEGYDIHHSSRCQNAPAFKVIVDALRVSWVRCSLFPNGLRGDRPVLSWRALVDSAAFLAEHATMQRGGQALCICRGRALLIVVEIDANRTTLTMPLHDPA